MGRYGVSTCRACRVVKTTRSSVYYTSRKDPLTALRQRARELAQARVRFGYRRLLVLLRREGWDVGKERFYRVYIEEGLALPDAHRHRPVYPRMPRDRGRTGPSRTGCRGDAGASPTRTRVAPTDLL